MTSNLAKVQLLATLQPAADRDQLDAEFADALRSAADADRRRLAWRVVDDPSAAAAGRAHVWSASSDGYTVVLEIAGDDVGSLTAAARCLAARIGPHVDAQRSTAIAGTEFVVVQAARQLPVLRLRPVRRRADLDHAQFADHWLHRHGPLAAGPPPMLAGYHQFHADPELGTSLVADCGWVDERYDGAAEAYFSDVRSFREMRSSADTVERAVEDERRFLDTSCVVAGLYEVRIV